MLPAITLPLVNGVRVVVPDSLDLITPYVLQEQQDWFEDEIVFLRKLLKPGQNVIDIGANYGVYTLSMAHAVGPAGRVWSFEPASSTAQLLAESIAVNGFSQVVLERSALSSAAGRAQLSLYDSPELNSLHGGDSAGASETVELTTLDQCLEKNGWRDIEFIKIDAEGEEVNILKGGERFFAELSPLVQYEVKLRGGLHLDLVRQFTEYGYESYRLAPGPGLLVPFDAGSPDGYLLNLFCCKPDRAAQLAANGYLLNAIPGASTLPAVKRDAYGWRSTIAKLPYGTQLAGAWEQTMAAGKSAKVDEALSLYALSLDSSRSPAERFGALDASYRLLKNLCERGPAYLRLASLARVAREHGSRSIAVVALQHLGNAISQQGRIDPAEPFLAPGARFDTVPPGQGIGNWVLAAVLEELERHSAFSSFYTGNAARQRLETIRALGFGSAEMARRLELLQKRLGPAPEPAAKS